MTGGLRLFLCIGLMIAAVIFIVRFPWILGGLIAFASKPTARCGDGSLEL